MKRLIAIFMVLAFLPGCFIVPAKAPVPAEVPGKELPEKAIKKGD